LTTVTGEPLQPIRLYFSVVSKAAVTRTLLGLRCVDEDQHGRRLVWLYQYEAAALTFGTRAHRDLPTDVHPVVIGELRFPERNRMVFAVRSADRAIEGAKFFKAILGANVSLVRARVVNRWFEASEAVAGSRDSGEPPKSTTRLGDWYANVLVIRRQHVVLAVSGVTLLPVLVLAAPYKTMVPRIAEAAGQVLRALKIAEDKIAAEEEAMREAIMTTTNDRRVLGSMNDFANMLDAYLDDRSLTEVALHLSDSPCSPLGMNNPREATLALFSAPGLRLVR
jgi:hypothetical protein